MKLTKTRLKQLIKEELAKLTESPWLDKPSPVKRTPAWTGPEQDDDDTYEEKYHGSRTERQDQEAAERRYDAAERMADEAAASTASSAAAFYKEHESKIDAVLDSIDHPDKDIINILVGLLYDDANPGV